MDTYPQNMSVREQVSPAEWEIRVDLAAAHRYAEHRGWTDLIFNHFSARVPDEPDHFLIKRHDLMFGEVTASNLLKIDLDGQPVGFDQNVNNAGYTIHSGVLAARPDVNAVCHVHSRAGEAIAARKGGLRCLTQGSMRFYNRIGYHDFEGVAEELGERERLGTDLGSNLAMIMRNHGLLTCGTTVRQACLILGELIAACEAQIQVEAMGAEINEVPAEVCEKSARQFDGFFKRSGFSTEWAAVLRLLDRLDPSYRD